MKTTFVILVAMCIVAMTFALTCNKGRSKANKDKPFAKEQKCKKKTTQCAVGKVTYKGKTWYMGECFQKELAASGKCGEHTEKIGFGKKIVVDEGDICCCDTDKCNTLDFAKACPAA